MIKQEFIENNRYEIYGEYGWEDFDGVVVNTGDFNIHEITTDSHSIKCTDKHKICVDGNMKTADSVEEGDILYTLNGNTENVISSQYIGKQETTYDIFNSDSHKVHINQILTSNCDEFAFVDPQWKADEFWASNYPTISASHNSKIIIISTPNGLYNKFHEIYSNAEAGKNSFIATKYDWRVVPGRTAEWAEEQKKNLGKVKFQQEFGCLSFSQKVSINNTETNEKECITVEELYERIAYEK